MGGPQIPFSYGRVDEMDPSAVTPDGRLPDADKGGARLFHAAVEPQLALFKALTRAVLSSTTS